MVAVLESIRERVIPCNVLQSVGSVPEEDSLLNILDVLCSILPSGSVLQMTAVWAEDVRGLVHVLRKNRTVLDVASFEKSF